MWFVLKTTRASLRPLRFCVFEVLIRCDHHVESGIFRYAQKIPVD